MSERIACARCGTIPDVPGESCWWCEVNDGAGASRAVQAPATPQEPDEAAYQRVPQCLLDVTGQTIDALRAENFKLTVELAETRRASAPPAVWQDIETAPKDGTEVLLLWFDAETGAAPMRRVGFWHSREQAWCDTHRVLHNQHSHPTHWMPLPNPPKRHLPSPPTPGGK